MIEITLEDSHTCSIIHKQSKLQDCKYNCSVFDRAHERHGPLLSSILLRESAVEKARLRESLFQNRERRDGRGEAPEATHSFRPSLLLTLFITTRRLGEDGHINSLLVYKVST